MSKFAGRRKNNPQGDFYPTPPEATRALLRVESFEGSIWEPACGDGAISKLLKGKIVSTDLYNHGYGIVGLNFLKANKLLAENIITNPPYKLALAFIKRGLELRPKKLALLVRLNYLDGINRYRDLYKDNPPSKIILIGRVRMSPGKVVENVRGGQICYIWLIWEKDYIGKTEFIWELI